MSQRHLPVVQPMHRASASKTEVLLKCQWWASPKIEVRPDVAGAPAIFGTAFHECMEKHIVGRKLTNAAVLSIGRRYETDGPRLLDHYRRGSERFDTWRKMRGSGEELVERAIAVNPRKQSARMLKPSKHRDYSSCVAEELPGTMDYALIPDSQRFPWYVVDFKTGRTEHDPYLTGGQVLTLGVGMTRLYPALRQRQGEIGYMHVTDTEVMFKMRPVSWVELVEHESALQAALDSANDTYPAMRDGPWCRYCPAFDRCPAQVGPMILKLVPDLMTETNDKIAWVHDRLLVLRKLDEVLTAQLKEVIETRGPITKRNGYRLELVTQRTTNLSMASIRRNLPDQAEKVIKVLDENGAIDHGEMTLLKEVLDPAAKL